jgi:UDP-N-acetylmuramoyl-tripeptide--D-alanyl-D-alanine ligase
MPEFSPDKMAAWTEGRWTRPPALPPVGFSIDTRRLEAGQAFVALRTELRDGHSYLEAAQEAGASAAIVESPNWTINLPQLIVGNTLAAFQAIAREHRREFRGPVVGISGSAGKTSTKNLLAILLGGSPDHAGPEESPVLATRGNLNNHMGVPLTLTRLEPAFHLYAVVEAGISGPGEMAPLAAMIAPDIAIITLVAPAHLEALGGMEGVAREKAQLPAALRAGGTAIFPAACAEFEPFRELSARALIVEPSGRDKPAASAPGRVGFGVVHQGGETTITLAGATHAGAFTLRRVSDGMAQNAAMAICAAQVLGLRSEAIQLRLASWRPAPLRGELRRSGGRLLYLDCYNANPASMADALAAFWAVTPQALPRLFVIGGMEELGLEAKRYHQELGRRLHLRSNDFLFVIGPHADAVRGGALENGNRPEQIAVVDSLEPIAARLATFAGSVFIKGSRKYALESLAGEEVAHA